MRFKWLNGYWVTIFLVLSVTLCSIWLARSGKLELYVHPRYVIFTVVMSLLAVVFIAADIVFRARAPKATPITPIGSIMAGILCMLLCAGLLIFRPAGLSSLAAGQRGINSGALNFGDQSLLTDLSAADAAYEQFSIKEWASLLAQTSDTQLFDGKPADITGFVSPASNNDPNVFYVARFVMTCCAVDARPIGVPVYKPNWRQTYHPDQWVKVQGVFMPNPETSGIPIVLDPKTITKVSEPLKPYVY